MADDELWEILPFDAGSFTFPDDEPWPGEQGVVVAHLLRSAGGRLFLFDTGIGAGHPELDARYHPVERHLADALAGAGSRDRRRWSRPRTATSMPTTPGRTIACPASRSTSSAAERAAASQPDYTVAGMGRRARACATSRSTATARCSRASRSSPAPGTRRVTSRCSSRHARGRVLLAGQAVYSRDEWEGRPGAKAARPRATPGTTRRCGGCTGSMPCRSLRARPSGGCQRERPVSRVLCRGEPRRRSSISTAGHPTAHAADPRAGQRTSPPGEPGLRPPIWPCSGQSLPRFTPSPKGRHRHCGTGPRLAADGRYPLPCAVELGLSSRPPVARRPRDRPAASLACGL